MVDVYVRKGSIVVGVWNSMVPFCVHIFEEYVHWRAVRVDPFQLVVKLRVAGCEVNSEKITFVVELDRVPDYIAFVGEDIWASIAKQDASI